jgi:hypothetical protein
VTIELGGAYNDTWLKRKIDGLWRQYWKPPAGSFWCRVESNVSA